MTVTCRVLKLSRQPYYRWLANPITPSEVVEAYRANALFDAHKDDPEFGHRLLADEAAEAGEAMADRTAWRIASSNGWFSAFGKPKRGKGRKPGPPVHDDVCAVIDEDGTELSRRIVQALDAHEAIAVAERPVDLTAAEARVARAIAQCRTVEQIAAEAGTSPQTVRSQLKGVMAKTGVSRQAELVGLLAGAALPRL